MKRIFLAAMALATTIPALAQDALLSGFAHPPAAARPRVWWHWMDGNVSKEGIRLDLEWMKRVGLGGVQMFDTNLGPLGTMTGGMPLDLKPRVVFGTPEWYEHLRFAASETDRLGLELTIHASGGWSETGGPWVKPEEGMKKLVWSELRVRGGASQTVTLPAPPSTTGPFPGRPAPGNVRAASKTEGDFLQRYRGAGLSCAGG